jgi:hypothetical protein
MKRTARIPIRDLSISSPKLGTLPLFASKSIPSFSSITAKTGDRPRF